MESMSPGWQPILHGPLAERAWASVRAIADDLASTAASPPSTAARRAPRPGDELLFWAYVAGALDDAASNAAYEAAMARFMESMKNAPMNHPGLYGSLWEPWVLAHVSEPGEHEAYFAAIDQQLAAILAVPSWHDKYEFVYGLAGYGIYQLDRLEHLAAARATGVDTADAQARTRSNLHAIVGHLARLAGPHGGGMTWFTPAHELPAHQRAYAPDGYYNMGLAHGVPGVVGMLGRLASTEANSPAAATLLAQATAWVWEQCRGGGKLTFFANHIVPPWTFIGKRTAWCYGDPGVLAALWIAAKHRGEPTDRIEALAVTCAERDPAVSGVVDSALCHGAFGLAHIYNRFFQASGNDRLRAAAVRWFELGLAQQGAATPAPPSPVMPPVGGYLQWTDVGNGVEGWGGNANFLTGSGGIALALLAALGHDVPTWDRLLLVDIPC